MAYNLWTQDDLVATLTDDRMDSLPGFARQFFRRKHFSAHREIRFNELPRAYRYLAPFVHPNDRGRPIAYEQGMSIKSFEPAYIKVKDSVDMEMLVKPQVQEIFRNSQQMGPQDRYDAEVAKIIDQHLRAIEDRKEWMRWQALRLATVQVDYTREQGAKYPSVTIDYGRAGNLTVLKNANYWDNAATDILGDVADWSARMNNAVRGGFPGIMYVGTAVAPVFGKNTGLKDLLNTQYNGNQGTSFGRGFTRIDPMGLTYIGMLPNGIEVWSFADFYSDENGTETPFLDPKEILMVAPGYEGIEANGLIYDMDAIRSGGGAVSAVVYPKMWTDSDKDNPRDWIMHQAAPLPIPLHPNKSFRARVLEA